MISLLRNFAKTCVFAACSNGYMVRHRVKTIRNASVVTILNMHRIAPADGSDYRPVHPDIFRATLLLMREHFDLTTFGGLTGGRSRKPRAIISFDDGYRDFVVHAMPILHELGIACNQNIIPQCVESGQPPLNVIAQDFVGKAPVELVARLDVPGFGKRVSKSMGAELSRFIKNRSHLSMQRLSDVLLPQFLSWHEFAPTPMMNRADVQTAGRYHEIGAHSYAHDTMQFESDAFVAADIRRCRAYFDEVLQTPMSIYAFPNGSCTASQVKVALDADIRHVLLVGETFDRGERVHSRFTFDGRTCQEAQFRSLGGFAKVVR